MHQKPLEEFHDAKNSDVTIAPGRILKVGFDFGANTSVVLASSGKENIGLESDVMPTVVGYPKPGVLAGILPESKPYYCGDEALRHKMHLNLKWPMERKGILADLDAARDFVTFVRTIVDREGDKGLWAVVGSPANAPADKLKELRRSVGHAFSRILILPEPFLAAVGLRDDSRLEDPAYRDPTRASLVVDIGAGTTDFCVVQGFYPTPNELISIAKGGNDIDLLLYTALKKKYPDMNLSALAVRRLKELHSFVGPPPRPVVIGVMMEGKARKIDVTEEIRQACESIVDDVVDSVVELISRTESEAIGDIMSNIVFVGGGCLIRGICEVVERRLHNQGYTEAHVSQTADYKRPVARGALKTANTVRDDQWQVPG
ncbi:MAG: rod shape-determining protein [Planctomycetota bacterium]|nr:rod shape-determining protein [Planctomycetota bacterium]